MTTPELLVISPIIAGVLTAVAVLLVDLVAPARR
jgi:hypothetical protein